MVGTADQEPGEDEGGIGGDEEGGRPAHQVDEVGQQDGGSPAQTEVFREAVLCCAVLCQNQQDSLVVCEAPQETADSVAHPEYGVDHQGPVVLLAHPVTLHRSDWSSLAVPYGG